MKRFIRVLTAAVCASVFAAGGIVSANAAECDMVCLPAGCLSGVCVVTPDGCSKIDLGDLKNNSSFCTDGKCFNVSGCTGDNCTLSELLSRYGIVPDSERCADCGETEQVPSEQPSAPVQESIPAVIPSLNPEENNTPSAEPAEIQSGISQYEKEVADIVNRYRAQYGLKPVVLSEELSKVARLKSADMKEKGYFSHTSPTYGSPFEMMKAFGINYRKAGENIAMGQKTPEQVMTAWMNSEGHRANILDPDFTVIGVGYVSDGSYWTQMFISE